MKEEVFLIEVNYRSGNKERFWVTEFSINEGLYDWKTVDNGRSVKHPVILGVDDIESVFQLEFTDKETFQDHYDVRDLRTSFEKERNL